MNYFLSFILILTVVVNHGFCYFVTVDAHAEECFFDRATKGSTLGLTFEVAEGGFLDIDIEVKHVVLVV